MSRNRSDEPGEPAVKVVDRRRFRPDGEAADVAVPGAPEAAAVEPGRGAAAPAPATPEAEERFRAQAARIDELSRAYAALLEDNKAFRARLERERDRVVEAERARVAQALLETADELEMAVSAAPEGDPLHRGVGLVLEGLWRRIGDLGAVRLEVAGSPFDPRVAEAVDVVEVAEAARDGLVVAEVRAGWRIGDRVLRPARVRVGRLGPPSDSQARAPGRE